MVLLRSKDQQQNNQLTTSATRLCRQRSGHECTASSSLHDTNCEPDFCAVWVSYRERNCHCKNKIN